MTVTPIYAALLALLFVTLSVRTLRMRRELRIPIGDAGNPRMLRAMRAHANCAEYVPLGLILMFLVETQGAHALLVHGIGMALATGRLLHACGVSREKETYRHRVAGMALTFTALVGSAGYLLAGGIRHLIVW